MYALSLGQPRTILCLGAHPDDIEIGCGGTLLSLLAQGAVNVHWHVFSGNAERAAEARLSADSFLQDATQSHVDVQQFRDSYFPDQWSEIKQYMESLHECRPDLIFTHFEQDRHQDHRVLAELTQCVFRNHLVLQYEIPKYDGDLVTPNLLYPLSTEICRAKVSGLLQGFPSQRDKHWFCEELFVGLMRLRGAEVAATYAEGFHVRKAQLS